MFLTVLQCTLHLASSFHSAPTQTPSLRHLLVLSSHLRPFVPSVSSDASTKIVHVGIFYILAPRVLIVFPLQGKFPR